MRGFSPEEFASVVRSELGRTLGDLQFREAKFSDNSATFVTAAASLKILWEPRSHEVHLAVFTASDCAHSYSLSELLRYWQYPDAGRYRCYCASDAVGLRTGLARMAALLQWCASKGMKFTSTEFRALEEQRQLISKEREDIVKREIARAKADAAWHANDYPEVAAQLSSIELFLTPAETKKLAFAKRSLQ